MTLKQNIDTKDVICGCLVWNPSLNIYQACVKSIM